MTIRLCKLDYVRAEGLRRLLDELFEIDVLVAVGVGTLHDLQGLSVVDPLETEGLQAVAYFLFAKLTVAVLVSGLEHLFKH